MELYLMLNGTQVGPYKIEDVQGWIKAGYVKMDDPAWYDGCKDWITVKEIPKINEVTSGHNVGGHLVPPFEAYAGDEPYIFISYAHKDSAQVFKEISQLNDAGYHIWYDEGIEASSEWPEEIANAVIGCSVFLVFISPRSTASVNCRNEINLALNEDKPFLAVHMEDSALPPGLRLRMGDLQAILQYKLPQDRYQKKVRDALDQLLGKKKKKIRSRPATATATTFAKMESNDAVGASGGQKQTGKKKLRTASAATSKSQTLQPKKKKSGLWFGIAAALIAAIGGYSFLASDGGEDGDSSASFIEGQLWTVPSIGLAMNWCEPGVFFMGSPSKEKERNDDETRHEVTLTQGFFLGKFEVTQEQWKAVMGTSPSKFFGPNRPVEQVSWDQAKRFCEELTVTEQKAGRLPEGWSYDLPTEAQWEYACRAGTDTMFYWGSAIGPSNANFKGSGVGGQTTEVGKYPANAWGFHDMSGNVNEWCSDWYAKFNSLAKFDSVGPDGGKEKSIKGGSWNLEIKDLRVAFRHHHKRGHKSEFKGFRLCLKQAPPERSEIEEAVKGSETSVLDLTRGLAGWWTFDEKSGKVANDSSGKIRAGKLVGYSSDTTQWSKGVIGNALRFDGKGSNVDIGDFEWGGESSVSFWSRWEASHRGSVILAVLDDSYLTLSNTFGHKNLQVIVRNDLSVTNIHHDNTPELRDFWKIGDWVHAGIVFKKNNQFEVYRDGKLVLIKGFPTLKKIKRSDQFIGMRNKGIGFKGQLDDFRMYDRAITPAEVEGLFALGKSFISKKAKGSVTFKVITKTANNNAAAGTKSLSVKVDVLGLNDSILASYPLKKPGHNGFSKGSVETFVFEFEGSTEEIRGFNLVSETGSDAWKLDSLSFDFSVDQVQKKKFEFKVGRWFSASKADIQKGSLKSLKLMIKAEDLAQKENALSNKIDLNYGLAGWWKFDETKGKVANDSSGKKRNGELKNFDSDTAQWVKGPVGNALLFDGKNDYVDVGDFEWGGECSFSGWVKYNKIQLWSRVFDFSNGAGKNEICLSNDSRASHLAFQNVLRSNLIKIPNFWQSGDWIHIVCQVHESGKSDIFKNGKLITSSIKKLTPKIFRKDQFFGKSPWSGNNHLNGELDDLRLYDRAITVAEVQALYGMGEVEYNGKMPVEGKPWTAPSIGLEMIWCNPGTFMIGSPKTELGRGEDEIQKKITFKTGFFLGKYEVTQKQFRDLTGKSLQSAYKEDENPAINVTWQQVGDFCSKLTELERREGRLPPDWSYVLPSETQWEYACRAGTTSPYYWGKEIDPKFAKYKTTDRGGPNQVGSYTPNNWGFHDMLGNVLEWCSDSKLRGGSWYSSALGIRSAARTHHSRYGGTVGFRVSLQKAF